MKKTIILAALIFQFAIFANAASAMCVCGGTPAPGVEDKDCLGPACVLEADPPGGSGATGGSSANLTNPIKANSVPELVGNIINVALSIVGSLALIMFIYGGFTWMLAAGNEQAVEKGKNILTWATIGLVVIFASYSLVNFIINKAIVGGGA